MTAGLRAAGLRAAALVPDLGWDRLGPDLLVGVCTAVALLVVFGAATPRALPRPGTRAGAGGAGRGARRGDDGGTRGPRRARHPPVPSAVLLDLVAEVVAGGAPLPRAVAAVGESLRAGGDPQAAELLALAARLAQGLPGEPTGGRIGERIGGAARAAPVLPVVRRLAEALDLAMATGASPVGLVRAAAQDERRARAACAVQRARRLAVLVLLPTGLCLLPAFILLTVVPLALSLALSLPLG